MDNISLSALYTTQSAACFVGYHMGKPLNNLKPSFTNLSKSFGKIRITALTKQCGTFLLIYLFFVLMHKIIGFKVEIWLSLSIVTITLERILNCKFCRYRFRLIKIRFYLWVHGERSYSSQVTASFSHFYKFCCKTITFPEQGEYTYTLVEFNERRTEQFK